MKHLKYVALAAIAAAWTLFSAPQAALAADTVAQTDSGYTLAQASRETATAPAPRRAAIATAKIQKKPGPISATLQRQLERGQVPANVGNYKAPGDDGLEAPDCKNGGCSCNGVVDCVGMTELCVPDTIGCNDYGCACQHNGNEPAGSDD